MKFDYLKKTFFFFPLKFDFLFSSVEFNLGCGCKNLLREISKPKLSVFSLFMISYSNYACFVSLSAGKLCCLQGR